MITPTLQKKIDASIATIRRAEPIALQYREFGAIVAFSGGKDSIVLTQLTKESGVKHILKHNLTTIDPPEVVRFIKREYPDCIIQRPKFTFWQLCEHAKILPSQDFRFCCRILKENYDENSLVMTGVRKAESARRKKREQVEIYTRRRHPKFTAGTFDDFEKHQKIEQQCIRGKDKLIVNPMLDWNANDVWNFIHDRNLSYPEIYDRGYTRAGCLFCPLSNYTNIMRQKKDYPKYYQAYLRMIKRMYDKRELLSDNISWHGLTPEQIFKWMASKKSIDKFRADLNQLHFDFIDE